VTEIRKSFWQRNGWAKWVAGGFLAALAVAAGIADLALHRAEPFLRARIVQGLENRFHARVELDSFHVSLVNGLWAEGKGLRIWPPAQVEGVTTLAGTGEPLIRLAEFRFHAPLRYSPGKPIHISVLELKGLIVHVPPRSHLEHPAAGNAPVAVAGKAQGGQGKPGLLSFVLEKMECTDAQLVLETSKPGKLPLEFAIARLEVTGIATDGAMKFDAELTNPRPKGTIYTTGTFGPWQTADPGESPITGDYRLEHADLATFHGIAGILSSTGRFQGTLRDITVDGVTNTPDFRLTNFGNALPLSTHFHAQVDGTDGDTWLSPVDATLGHSHFTAEGQIVRVVTSEGGGPPHSVGHDIALKVNVDKARIEDFLALAGRTNNTLLTGAVTLKTTLHIAPGTPPVHERLKLDGWFVLDNARFTSSRIQGRIAELSLRGQGRPNELKTADAGGILSHMEGSFQLGGGVLTLPRLNYTVPGAKIDLKGAYGLDGGTLNFAGTARMDATVSAMVGGWKGILLKPANRFLKKDGAGTLVPIHIEGTREDPKFGIDFDRLKGSSAERPGEKP
jgi:hypothetical protein